MTDEIGTCDKKQYEHSGQHVRVYEVGQSMPPFSCVNWKPTPSLLPEPTPPTETQPDVCKKCGHKIERHWKLPWVHSEPYDAEMMIAKGCLGKAAPTERVETRPIPDLELRKVVRKILNFGRKTPGNLPQFDAAMDEAFAYLEAAVAPSPAGESQELTKLREWMESYRKDCMRPDEWTLQEWIQKCDEMIKEAK